MGIGLFNVGMSGMGAAQAGLVTTGHNISNASTRGYSRQEVIQTANTAQAGSTGFLGQGVAVNTVRRLYSDTLSNQLTLAQTQGSQIDTYNAQIKQLSNMLGDASTGLAPALANFFSGVAELAAHPASVSSRQALLSSANTLTGSFRDLDQQMTQMRTDINSGISSSVASVNSYAQQIAGLNQSILKAESSTSQSANDLRDQRDQLVAALNKEVHASVLKQSDGSYAVFIGNGQPLVVGEQTFQLSAKPSDEDSNRMVVAYANGGTTATLPDSSLQGGALGGLLSFRNESLDDAQNSLGRLAIGLAQSFNAQHSLGLDLNGALGGSFFSYSSPRVLADANNTGPVSVDVALQDSSALTTSDYRLQYQGSTSGNENFLLTKISDGTSTTVTFPSASGYPYKANVDGLSLTLTSGAALNDSWTIEPTRFGAASIAVALTDPAQIAAASPIRAQALLGNSSNASLSAGTISSTVNLPLPADVTLTFDALTSQFTVAGALPSVSPIAYSAGTPISFNGLSFSILGTPSNGDVFTIASNNGGSADNRNALALAALQTSNTLGRNAGVTGSLASTSYGGAFSQLVSKVGNTARQTDVMATAQTNVITQAQQAQQSVSGVNLDEEAANLLRYQQAYQASGKMMQIANSLFQTVLDL
ncbi:MAG: flagellar hook-associated protein FlgK [Comamonadaceae bacterium]